MNVTRLFQLHESYNTSITVGLTYNSPCYYFYGVHACVCVSPVPMINTLGPRETRTTHTHNVLIISYSPHTHTHAPPTQFRNTRIVRSDCPENSIGMGVIVIHQTDTRRRRHNRADLSSDDDAVVPGRID